MNNCINSSKVYCKYNITEERIIEIFGINSSKVYCKFSQHICSMRMSKSINSSKVQHKCFFIVLVLYPPIVLIETDCKIDISISNFKFLYICLTTFSFFQLNGIIYKTQFIIGVEIDENYKI